MISSCVKNNILMSSSFLTGRTDNYLKQLRGFMQEKSKGKAGLELQKIFQESTCKCDPVFQNVGIHIILKTLFNSIDNDYHFFVPGKRLFYFTLLNSFLCCWKMVSNAVYMH